MVDKVHISVGDTIKFKRKYDRKPCTAVITGLDSYGNVFILFPKVNISTVCRAEDVLEVLPSKKDYV